MRRTRIGRGLYGHALVFAACVACTLWLIVQNTLLLTLLPKGWLSGALAGSTASVSSSVAALLPWMLIPLAFALGWLAPHLRGRDADAREARHD